jgi:CBS domain-containing protein
MITNIITVSSDISILEAKEIMIINKIGCLPILEGVDLIGILTKRDVEKLEQIPDKND